VLGAFALASILMVTVRPIVGLSSDLVISQVYGGGGNSGAPYKNDFVEIFNRGTVAASLNGKSIQYASATGTGNFGSNPIAILSGTLQPGQYYLVQLAGGTVGSPLPVPDASGTVNASGSAGKFALVNATTGLACNGGSTPCSPAQTALIIDLVGYGNANYFEGAAAGGLSNTTAAIRNGGGCVESDSNANDFTVGSPTPRNTASPFGPCAASTPPTGSGAATPGAVVAGDPTKLTVAVTPGANPASTGISVTANLGAIGGSTTQPFFDNGTNGDMTAGDNVFSFDATVPSGTATGAKSLPVTITDAQSRSGSASISLTVLSPPLPIHDIQGAGTASPLVGLQVTTQGIVTALRFNNGFFIQTPDALVDADPNTSEGLFVFTGTGNIPVGLAAGNYVQVTGTVQEYSPSTDPYSPPLTEIVTPVTTVLASGYALPAAVTLTAADLPLDGVPEQIERFEGMRVFVQSLRAVSGTGGTKSEANATSTSNGTFYAVIDGTPRPFREPGIQVPDPLPAGAPPTVTRFDSNAERLRVNSWGQIGATRFDVTTGALVSNTTGVLDYGARTYTILPDPLPTPTVSGLTPGATPVPAPDANEFTIASFNLERFYDDFNDPGGDVALTTAAYQGRLNKASLSIRTVMRMPDIIGVEEVEKLSALQALAAKVNTDAVDAGDPNPGYVAYLEEGNDPGGIDVGFLVKSSRVDALNVQQYGKDTLYTPPTGPAALLNDRPPLLLEAVVHGPLGVLPVTVIVNHLRSLNNIDDAVDGPRVRAKRLAQAEYLANLVQARQTADPDERIVLVGDFNAFEFSDGYVDVIGSIKGTPAPADSVVLAGADLVNPDLTDLAETVPAADRYSYSFDGNAQVLDHVIANGRALLRFSRLHYGRTNADFPEAWRGDTTRPERLSDHDPAVAYFVFPDAPVLTLNGSNPMAQECCGVFTDPGATASDTDYGDLTPYITVSGSVDADTVGSYTLTYSVSNYYTTTTVERTVNVVDTTPPLLTLVGASPMTVELGSTFADPGATASDTCAGDLLNSILISGAVDTANVGTYVLTYSVSDGYNTTAVSRTVKVVDTTPPALSAVTPSPAMLWPPNHKMVGVKLAYSATDASGSTACSVGVLSNEPDNGTGDGDTAVDWMVSSATLVQLRAERMGSGSGRIYTVTVTCRDASNNVAVGRTTVTVPKSKGK
jgi:predicted extracellular nuclease